MDWVVNEEEGAGGIKDWTDDENEGGREITDSMVGVIDNEE